MKYPNGNKENNGQMGVSKDVTLKITRLSQL